MSGCVCISALAKAPRDVIRPFHSSDKQKQELLSNAALQIEVMRFADEFSIQVAQACDDFKSRVSTPAARKAALEWKIGQCSSAMVTASGENPMVNLLDMVVLISLGRMVQEDDWVAKTFGEPARPILQKYEELETEVWAIGKRALKPDQEQELRDLIRDWRSKNPSQNKVAFVHLRDFVKSTGQAPAEGRSRPGSVFSLFFVDPLAGLDPAARELALSRQMAERAVYQLQRMPHLLGWQAELLAYEISAMPEVTQFRADSERLTKSIESVSKTAAQFPQLIVEQRQAAIQQVLDGVALERTNFLASLNDQQHQMQDLLANMRLTLTAGSEMANSVNAAVKSLDSFVGRFDKGTNVAATTAAITNSRPFDVLDYGKAAGDIALAARELNSLVGSVNETLPKVTNLSDQTSDRVAQQMRRAFWLGVVLIVLFLTGALLAALAYRALTQKWFTQPTGRKET